MSNIIVFDFEVFVKDVLLGAYIINKNGIELFQSWDVEEIKDFYKDNISNIWVGHNNECYDNHILEAIVKGRDPKKVSDEIIEKHKRKYLSIKLYYYDLIKFHPGSLKVMEAFAGKNISESKVSFNIDRKLTEKEKLMTELYNKDDIDQTLQDFTYLQDEFSLRLDLIEEFNLSLDYLCATQAKIAAKVLKAEFHDEYQNIPVYPRMYEQLKVNNQEVIDFYMNRKYAEKDAELKLDFGGTPHVMKAGGIHGAIKNCYFKVAYYLDVSGYYNLVMIIFGLLPRSIPEEGKKLYEYMYHEQLRLKEINPTKRQVYKVILLAVFGAMNNEYCEFCDPWHGDLVRMTGQIFLVDLLEKLINVARIIQSNTDGIMCVPLEGHTSEEIKVVIDEWQNRTGFKLKYDKIFNLYQRDVNNYIYQDGKGKIHTKGEAVKYYGGYDNPYDTNAYMSKEPLIISKCIVEYCLNGKLPEETVEESKSQIRLFQSICKKGTFDWVEFEENRLGKDIKITKVQNVNRAFASNSKEVIGTLYKRKYEGKTTKSRIAGVPENVFLFNNSLDKFDRWDDINYQYYIDRAYRRIWEFIGEI